MFHEYLYKSSLFLTSDYDCYTRMLRKMNKKKMRRNFKNIDIEGRKQINK